MTRTNWTRAEIAALFDLPFTELVFRAAEVGPLHHDAARRDAPPRSAEDLQ